MTTRPSSAELAILSRKGSWVVGLAATSRALTDLLVSHILAEGELHGWELLNDFSRWYMEAAEMGVDLSFVTAHLEDTVSRNINEPDVMSVIDSSFLSPIRLALEDPAQRQSARAAVAALGPKMQARAREMHAIIHADPKMTQRPPRG